MTTAIIIHNPSIVCVVVVIAPAFPLVTVRVARQLLQKTIYNGFPVVANRDKDLTLRGLVRRDQLELLLRNETNTSDPDKIVSIASVRGPRSTSQTSSNLDLSTQPSFCTASPVLLLAALPLPQP